jgi:hypothetical protein
MNHCVGNGHANPTQLIDFRTRGFHCACFGSQTYPDCGLDFYQLNETEIGYEFARACKKYR